MKTTESLLILLALYVVLAALAIALTRKSSSSKKTVFQFVALTVASTLTLAHAVATPTEEKSSKGANVFVQYIVMDENSGFGYQRAIVLAPSSMPLPTFAGELAAVAPVGARLEVTQVNPVTLSVRAVSTGTTEKLLPQCGAAELMGVVLQYDAPVPDCPRE